MNFFSNNRCFEENFGGQTKNQTNLNAYDKPNNIHYGLPSILNKNNFSNMSFPSNQHNVEKFSEIKPIKYIHFKIRQTFIEMRARSNSPKEGVKMKTSMMKEKELSQKYRKLRIENHENQLKLVKMFNELQNMQNDGILTKKYVDLCFQIIKSLIQISSPNEFEKPLEILLNSLEKFIYADKDEVLTNLENYIGKKNYSLEGFLWKELIEQLCFEVITNQKKSEEILESIKQEKKFLTQNLETQIQENDKMKKNLEMIERTHKHSNNHELLKYQEKLKHLEFCLQKLTNETCKLKEEYQISNESMLNEKTTLEKMNEKKLSEINQELEKWKKDSKEKDFEISSLKLLRDNTIEEFKTIIRAMKLNQEKVTKLEEKVASLMNENQSLKVRAAVSFDELTPRPSFSNFKELFDLSENFLEKKSTKIKSEELYKICKNYITAEVPGFFSPKRNKNKKSTKIIISDDEDKNEDFSSYLTTKLNAFHSKKEIISKKSQLLENPTKLIEFNKYSSSNNLDIIQQEKFSTKNNLKIRISRKSPMKGNEIISEPISAKIYSFTISGNSQRKNPDICKESRRLLKKSKSP